MSDKENDIILEQAFERVSNEQEQERLDELLAINDLEGIYNDG
jgi:hypothetical protein